MAKRLKPEPGTFNDVNNKARKAEAASDTPRIFSNGLDSSKTKSFVDRLDRLHDEKEEKNGEFMADIKSVYEEAAEALGVKKKAFTHEYRKHRRAVKDARKESEWEPEVRDDAEAVRDALGAFAETALGQHAVDAAGDGAEATTN